ncbi:hypothetical protein Nepgr_019860 [Nepenthes gracilis]|uniref:Uncharacterized protein n=1 Tax=Nepenthes gracilis TaxID=150966 RepID=A0AAD3SWK7_NEPGR|nr:hypothetical protein Nepgr_019860 [Nepenthes gracilis]
MGTIKENAQASSDHKKWEKIFSAFVQLLKTQQSQIKTLVEERKRLEDRIKIQYDRWVSDVRLSEDQISQMKRETELAELARLVDAAKADLMMGFKRREALCYKLKLEDSQDELTDFKAWFDFLCPRRPDQLDTSVDETLKGKRGETTTSKILDRTKPQCLLHQTLEEEVKRLKHENNKLSVKNSSEVSALLSEKDFVWNQYRNLESSYIDKLSIKNDQVKELNERILKLLASIEELQSLKAEKDGKIASMEAVVANLEAEAKKKNEQATKLSKELELLRGLKTAAPFVTPALKHCQIEQKICRLEGRSSSQNSRSANVKKESASMQVVHGQGNKIMKRKSMDSETPNLFTSSFKIPKLRSSTPRVFR